MRHKIYLLWPVLCIRDIWYGSGSRSFSSLPSPTKISFFQAFCLFLTLGTLTLVFKDNISLRIYKAEMVYFNFFAY